MESDLKSCLWNPWGAALIASVLVAIGLPGCGGSDDDVASLVRATEYGRIELRNLFVSHS